MNETPVTSNDLAVSRTIMALERTLMAWLRTALSLISFGFTIYKLLQGLQEKDTLVMRPNAPRNLGLLRILTGMALLAIGIVEYGSAKKQMLRGSNIKVPIAGTLLACYGILAMGLFTLLNILFGVGGF